MKIKFTKSCVEKLENIERMSQFGCLAPNIRSSKYLEVLDQCSEIYSLEHLSYTIKDQIVDETYPENYRGTACNYDRHAFLKRGTSKIKSRYSIYMDMMSAAWLHIDNLKKQL